MDVRMLESFVAVAEEGGFTRAAARLHVVQSTVSASVRALETQIGLRLFDRGTRSVRLTPQGRSFLPSARAALTAMTEARDAAASLAGGVAGTVGVGVLVIPDMLGIATAIARLGHEHPGVRVLVRSAVGGTGALQRDVAAGTLDLCFIVEPIPVMPELELERMASGRYILTCGEGHPWAGRTDPIRPEELSGAAFVEFPSGFSARHATDAEMGRRGIVRRTQVEVAHLDLIAAYVAAGVGVGFVTEPLLRIRDDLFRLETPWLDMRWIVSVTWLRTRLLSRAAETFLDEVRANCAMAISAGLLEPA